MSCGPRLGRGAAVIAAAGLLVPVATVSASAQPHQQRSDSVIMSVTGVSPSTPAPTHTPATLTVQLTLRNTSNQIIKNVRITGERGEPITDQSALDASLADSSAPATSMLDISPTQPTTVDLPPEQSVSATFTTTTSTVDDHEHLCLCATAEQPLIYPLYFSAHVTGGDGVDQRLGVTSTYVPSFNQRPAPVHVSWIWPLLERPHRLLGGTTFTDDLLADSVGPDGRLSKALEVVEDVGATIPLTLMIDPELLDELETMAKGNYTVATHGKPVPGTGQTVAAAWLDRLRTVLTTDPDVDVELTPYADPDVQSLQEAGLQWSSSLPAEMITPVTTALAGRSPSTAVAWPAAGVLGDRTLRTMSQHGVSTVVLDSSAITPKPKKGAILPGLARVAVGNQDVAVALTSAAIEKDTASAVSVGGTGAAALPSLIAELAVRAAQEPDTEHVVAITAPRYVDPVVDDAVRTIKDTTTSEFAEPIGLTSAVGGSLLPTGRSLLAKVPRSVPKLDSVSEDAVAHASATLPAIGSLLDSNDPTARTLLIELPLAVQRLASSAWLEPGAAATAKQYARQLTREVNGTTHGVHIVRPSSGSYTLGSSSSPLPITVDNELPYPVSVRLEVRTVVNGLPGFSTKDIGEQHIDANQKKTVNIPTRTERSGRISVEAVLLTPNSQILGAPVPLTVRSTALGFVGVVITIVAGGVLALALLIRLVRRLRKRRPGPTEVRRRPLPHPEPVP